VLAPELAPEIGARIRRAREANDCTRAELAVRVGRSEQSIWLWETGRHLPPLPVLVVVAETLGLTLDALVRGRP